MVGSSVPELIVAWSDTSYYKQVHGYAHRRLAGMQAVYSALSRAGATQKYSFIASWISREVRWKKAGLPA